MIKKSLLLIIVLILLVTLLGCSLEVDAGIRNFSNTISTIAQDYDNLTNLFTVRGYAEGLRIRAGEATLTRLSSAKTVSNWKSFLRSEEASDESPKNFKSEVEKRLNVSKKEALQKKQTIIDIRQLSTRLEQKLSNAKRGRPDWQLNYIKKLNEANKLIKKSLPLKEKYINQDTGERRAVQLYLQALNLFNWKLNVAYELDNEKNIRRWVAKELLPLAKIANAEAAKKSKLAAEIVKTDKLIAKLLREANNIYEKNTRKTALIEIPIGLD